MFIHLTLWPIWLPASPSIYPFLQKRHMQFTPQFWPWEVRLCVPLGQSLFPCTSPGPRRKAPSADCCDSSAVKGGIDEDWGLLIGGVWHEPARLRTDEPGTRGPCHPGTQLFLIPGLPGEPLELSYARSGFLWEEWQWWQQHLEPGSTMLSAPQPILSLPLVQEPHLHPPTQPSWVVT